MGEVARRDQLPGQLIRRVNLAASLHLERELIRGRHGDHDKSDKWSGVRLVQTKHLLNVEPFSTTLFGFGEGRDFDIHRAQELLAFIMEYIADAQEERKKEKEGK